MDRCGLLAAAVLTPGTTAASHLTPPASNRLDWRVTSSSSVSRGEATIATQERQFEYGPLARGSFHGMLALVLIIPLYFPNYALYYMGFVAFLGLGLRPFLELTGLYTLLSSLLVVVSNKHYEKFEEERRRKIDRKLRDAKYRGLRRKDPRLPRNW